MLSTQISTCNHHSPLQGTRAPGDTADSRGGGTKYKMRLKHLTVSKSKEMLKDNVGRSGHRKQLEKAPTGQIRDNLRVNKDSNRV